MNTKKHQKNEVTIVPIGGCGEFGMNMTLYLYKNQCFVVDAGSRFPSAYQSGIDCVVPNVEDLFKGFPEITAYIITHGHEDHIGALPYIYKRWPAPIFAPAWAASLIERKFERLSIESHPIEICSAKFKKSFDDCSFTWVPLNHSIPDACALHIQCGDKNVFHTGDFKIDPEALYEKPADLAYLKSLAKNNFDLLIADSTNAHKPGRCPSESIIEGGLRPYLESARGRTVITTFSSNLWRLMTITKLCQSLGKKIFVLGRGLENTFELAEKLKFFIPPKGVFIERSEIPDYDPKEVIVLATGCQGERLAGLNRLVSGHIKTCKLGPEDQIIFSSRIIPGNELSILNITNQCEKLGCDVITQYHSDKIHVSGHGYEEDLRDLMRIFSPKYFLPIHGSYFHLNSNNRIFEGCARKVKVAHLTETGNVFCLNDDGLELVDHIELDKWFVDQGSQLEMDYLTLKQRLKVGERGQVIFAGMFDKKSRTWAQEPQMSFVGLTLPGKTNSKKWQKHLHEKMARHVSEHLDGKGFDIDSLNESLRIKLRQRFDDVLNKKPEVKCQVFLV